MKPTYEAVTIVFDRKIRYCTRCGGQWNLTWWNRCPRCGYYGFSIDPSDCQKEIQEWPKKK